jgi:flavin-dependent dehydrogenase
MKRVTIVGGSLTGLAAGILLRKIGWEVNIFERSRQCFRQLDLAPFDRFIWPHPLVNPLSAPGRSEALRSPKGDAFRA